MSYKKLRTEYTLLLEQLTVNLIKQLELKEASEAITDAKKKGGVVYVINQVGTNNYKIGYSKNYADRMKLFGVQLPFEIQETATYEVEDYAQKEKELHAMFAHKRLNNSEFFELAEEDLKEIEKYMMKDEVTDVTDDDLLDEAKAAVLKFNRASVSFLQSHLSIGFSRASRLMRRLEEEKFVGTQNGSMQREILYSQDNDPATEEQES